MDAVASYDRYLTGREAMNANASPHGPAETFPELIPCTTTGCGAAPNQIPPTVGLAIVEHGIRSDPAFVLKLPCDACGRTSRYTFMKLLSMVPPERRPGVLGVGHEWVFVLRQVATLEDGRNVLVGDRILARTRMRRKGWVGRALGKSAFEPRITPGSGLAGTYQSGWRRVLAFKSGGQAQRLSPIRNRFPEESVFAIVYEGSDGSLAFDNALCSNPVCSWIFKKTWSEMREDLSTGLGSGARPTVECPLCGWARVLDEESFWAPPFTCHPSVPDRWLAIDVPSVVVYTSGSLSEASDEHPFLEVRAKSFPEGLWSVWASERVGERHIDWRRDIELGVIHTPEDLVFAASEASRLTDFSFEPLTLRPVLPDFTSIDRRFAKDLRRYLEGLETTSTSGRSPAADRAVEFFRNSLRGPDSAKPEGKDIDAAREPTPRSKASSDRGTVSPVTGQRVDIHKNQLDESVLFVYSTHSRSYQFISERIRTHASTLGVRPEQLDPADLLDMLRLLLPEAEGNRVDTGGGNFEFYAFAPADT